jgi:pimeloyl-ACP methyl ester carboxylesterase
MPNFRRNFREPRPGMRCNIKPLAASRIPVLALIPRNGTGHDGPMMAQRYRQQLPHAQVELVDDSNHLVFIDRTDVATDQLQKFLCTA